MQGTLAQAAVPAKTTKKKKKPKPKSASTKQIDIDASAKAASEAARVKAEEQQRIRLEALERQRLLEDELLEKRKQVLCLCVCFGLSKDVYAVTLSTMCSEFWLR